MSDLLSPILYVMEDEVEAFWCFTSYMQQLVRRRERRRREGGGEMEGCGREMDDTVSLL